MPWWQINPSRAVGNVYIISELRNPWGSNCWQLGRYFKGYFTVGFFFFFFPLSLLNFRIQRGDSEWARLWEGPALSVPSLCTLAAHPCQNSTLHFPAQRQKWGEKNGNLKFSPKKKMENPKFSPHHIIKVRRFCHLCVPVPAGKFLYPLRNLKPPPQYKDFYNLFAGQGFKQGLGDAPGVSLETSVILGKGLWYFLGPP